MLEGNIVLSAEIVDAEDVTSEDLAHFVAKEGRGQTISGLRHTIVSRKLCMVLVSPSYGAELGCVCSSAMLS